MLGVIKKFVRYCVQPLPFTVMERSARRYTIWRLLTNSLLLLLFCVLSTTRASVAAESNVSSTIHNTLSAIEQRNDARRQKLDDIKHLMHVDDEHVSLDYVEHMAPNYTLPRHARKVRIDLRPPTSKNALVQCDNFEFVERNAPSDYVFVLSCSVGNIKVRDRNTATVACLCNEAANSGHDNNFWKFSDVRRHCDVVVGPSPRADVPTSFMRWTIAPQRTPFAAAAKLKETPRDPRFREDAPVAFVQRNCKTKSGRENFVRRLSRYVRVDSMGSCLHNRDVEGLRPRESETVHKDTKFNVLSNYMFTIALENTNECGYVTEKIYDAIAAGSVPIVAGMPCNEHLLPHPESVVRTRDFGNDPARVAAYIQRMKENHDEYMAHHRWKHVDSFTRDWVESALFKDFTSVICRLAKLHIDAKNG